MKITSLNCNNCGANLEVQPNVKFFTCKFCKSSLSIKHSGNVVYTEVLDEIKNNTEILIDSSEEMLIEKKIARLDREWMIQSQKYQTTGKNGRTHHPENSNGVVELVGFILAFGFIIFWISKAMSIDDSGVFPLFGFGMMVILIITFVSHLNNKNSYDSAKSNYLQERNRLLSELEKNN